MSAPSSRRLAAAREIAGHYARLPGVVAVLCAGSTARGQADRWSDLELAVVWSAPPADAQRRAAISAAGGQDAQLWPRDEAYRVWEDAWRTRLTPYPRSLAAEAVRRHGQIEHFWRWQMYGERGDVLQLQAHFAGVAVQVVHVACALSGVWWPGTKRLTRTAAGLSVAPANLAGRLQRIPCLAIPAAAADLTALVEESYDLVDAHLPEVDAERLRAIFRFARQAW